jgi:hypothetical protein
MKILNLYRITSRPPDNSPPPVIQPKSRYIVTEAMDRALKLVGEENVLSIRWISEVLVEQ